MRLCCAVIVTTHTSVGHHGCTEYGIKLHTLQRVELHCVVVVYLILFFRCTHDGCSIGVRWWGHQGIGKHTHNFHSIHCVVHLTSSVEVVFPQILDPWLGGAGMLSKGEK